MLCGASKHGLCATSARVLPAMLELKVLLFKRELLLALGGSQAVQWLICRH